MRPMWVLTFYKETREAKDTNDPKDTSAPKFETAHAHARARFANRETKSHCACVRRWST